MDDDDDDVNRRLCPVKGVKWFKKTFIIKLCTSLSEQKRSISLSLSSLGFFSGCWTCRPIEKQERNSSKNHFLAVLIILILLTLLGVHKHTAKLSDKKLISTELQHGRNKRLIKKLLIKKPIYRTVSSTDLASRFNTWLIQMLCSDEKLMGPTSSVYSIT